jgi:hypothetical protein
MSSILESLNALPVAVIGAGPIGLAAAAHLAARDVDFVVYEAGEAAGANVASWGHVRLFSPWSQLVDPVSRRLLESEGWVMPPAASMPTGNELVSRYLRPLAETAALSPFIRYRSPVRALSRRAHDKVKTGSRFAEPFVLTTTAERALASAVIDASGTWGRHNPLGADGVPAPGEAEASDRISFGLPDVLGAERSRFAGRRVMVAGAGHSAANVILDLLALSEAAPGTTVVWALRGAVMEKAFGAGSDDQLAGRGALGDRLRAAVATGAVEVVAGFAVDRIDRAEDGLVVSALDGRRLLVDEIVASTGQRPDLDLARELRVDLDPWLESPRGLAPLIDPNVHSCGTVPPHGVEVLSHPEEGFYTVGIKSYGRAPTFLTLTGYEQVRSVVAEIAGDLEAAGRIELTLPETGVCSVASPACC